MNRGKTLWPPTTTSGGQITITGFVYNEYVCEPILTPALVAVQHSDNQANNAPVIIRLLLVQCVRVYVPYQSFRPTLCTKRKALLLGQKPKDQI